MLRGILIWLTQIVILGITGTVIVTSTWLLGQHNRFALWGVRTWGRWMTWACGATLEAHDVERLASARPAILVCNHSSELDIYSLAAVTPQPFMFPAKAALFRIPLLGPTMRAMGCVPLERTRSTRDINMIEVMSKEFEANAIVIFFAEGTRSRDGRLQPFKKGAFTMALRHKVPVVPVAITGAHRIRPAGAFGAKAGHMRIEVLEALPTADLGISERDRLMDQAWNAILEALPEDQRPLEDERDQAPPQAATTA